jgi:hypothetical protein
MVVVLELTPKEMLPRNGFEIMPFENSLVVTH